MKIYSSVEEQVNAEENVSEKPAPYNWLALLIIVLAYVVYALVF
jgi:hypothetical protein